MNVIAFVLALLAVLVLVFEVITYGTTKAVKQNLVALGLALLAAAWIVQSTWVTTHIVHT